MVNSAAWYEGNRPGLNSIRSQYKSELFLYIGVNMDRSLHPLGLKSLLQCGDIGIGSLEVFSISDIL